MRDKEILDLSNAYKKICEQQVGVPIPAGKTASEYLKTLIPKGEKVVEPKDITKKTTLQKASYEPEDKLVDVYDEVLEYLLGEGYSEEDSKQIMVDLINEGGLGSVLKGVAKFVQKRASTPIKTAVTDLATTAIASGSAPAAKLSTSAVRSATPTPIVRTVKSSVLRTTPKGANVTPDPWKQSSSIGSRLKEILKGNTPKPTTQRALSGSQAPASLPSGTRGGQLAKATPGGSITPIAKPGSLARTNAKPTSITPAAKPTTGKPSSTRIEPVNVKDVTASTKSLSGAPDKPALPSGRSQQFKDVQRLTKSTGGGLMGTTKPTNLEPRAPKPAWGSDAKPAATAKQQVKPTTVKPTVSSQSTVDKAIAQTSSKQTAKPAAKPSGGGTGSSAGLRGLVGPAAAGAVLGVAADMAFPRSTAPGTRDKAPKLPTSAKEVKKGETYYDPSTRVGSSQRFAQRKKVGPKIVGPGKVGTPAQDFDRAYKDAKEKSGMGSTFTWKGKSYKVM